MVCKCCPPAPVITAPAGSEVAVDAVLVTVYIQVELTVALTPWACHAEERVSVNAGAVRKIICPPALDCGAGSLLRSKRFACLKGQSLR